MRRRNEVPLLKQIAARKVSWPDGIDRKEKEGHFPSIEQYCRETIYQNFFKKDKMFKKKRWKETCSLVIDNWIHLSSYYGVTFGDLSDLTFFLKSHPPESLDFLRQGFVLTDERDKAKMIPLIGKIPYSVLPRTVSPKMWKDMAGDLIRLKLCESLKELQVKFGIEDKADTHHESHGRKTILFIKSKEKEHLDRIFEFQSTLSHFKSLTKLVIKGLEDDSVLPVIGESCICLKYLDIKENTFSADGIRYLFFTSKEAEQRYRDIHLIQGKVIPKKILRPLTKTLEYFEMDEVPRYQSSFDFKTGICIACPQLVQTAHNLFFAPRGDIKFMSRGYWKSPTLLGLRQDIVLRLRTKFCHDIFCFVRGFLACIPTLDPGFQVRVDEDGKEVTFLFFAHQYVIAKFDIQDLIVTNFTSYSISATEFINVELLSHFAPGLLSIKAPLTGCVSKKYPLSHIRFITCSMIRNMDTLKSIIKKCPALKYLEIREILLNDTHLNDADIEDLFQHENEHIEVLRFLFKNKISLTRGVFRIITKCRGLRILGDLKNWGIGENSFLSFTLQLRFHNFRVSVEYDGVIHYTDGYGGEILR